MNKQNNLTNRLLLRKCVGCQSLFERGSLIRIMNETSSGNILIEPDKKHYGRSVYLCKNEECLKNALKKNKLSRVLKKKISDEDLEILRGLF